MSSAAPWAILLDAAQVWQKTGFDGMSNLLEMPHCGSPRYAEQNQLFLVRPQCPILRKVEKRGIITSYFPTLDHWCEVYSPTPICGLLIVVCMTRIRRCVEGTKRASRK
jgi:hypothetical protein